MSGRISENKTKYVLTTMFGFGIEFICSGVGMAINTEYKLFDMWISNRFTRMDEEGIIAALSDNMQIFSKVLWSHRYWTDDKRKNRNLPLNDYSNTKNYPKLKIIEELLVWEKLIKERKYNSSKRSFDKIYISKYVGGDTYSRNAKSANKCIYCGRTIVDGEIQCEYCKSKYQKKRNWMGGYPSYDGYARGSNNTGYNEFY